MRDFNMRDNNGGNIIINEPPKLLVQCSNEELFVEEKHRKNLLRQERARKFSITIKFLFGVLLLCGIASIWCYIKGLNQLMGLVSILVPILIAGVTLQTMSNPTEFEQRQLATLNEISMILRDRSVR